MNVVFMFRMVQGIFVDADGYVCEGPAMNVGFILKDGTLVIPPFDKTLAGVTIRRIMALLPKVCLTPSHACAHVACGPRCISCFCRMHMFM
jgi:hypothetical protein